MLFLSFYSLQCFSWKTSWLLPFAAMLYSKGILGNYLHHANMLNCRVCFTFPYPQTERPHAHIDYMINTRASVCHWSSEEKTDSRSISSPHSIPSVGIGFSSVQTPHPPTLTQPLSFPKLSHCHHILQQTSCTLCDGSILCLSLTHPHPCAAPTFLCSLLLYKKYNPIDPKPDGKRWSVNRRVLNNRCPVL